MHKNHDERSFFLRKADIIILTICAVTVFVSALTVFSWLNQAEGFPAASGDILAIDQDPLQDSSIREAMPVLHFGKKMIVLSAKAKYQIDGVLVSKKRYYRGFMSDLAPYDFALIWADVPNLQDQLKFKQVVRYCLFYLKKDATVDPLYVQNHMSNNHLIPASKNIRKAMRKAKKGDLIRLQGHLVDVEASHGGRLLSTWRSSETREDTGSGACEIIYVTSLRINDMVYR
jgi:hypothetical protein